MRQILAVDQDLMRFVCGQLEMEHIMASPVNYFVELCNHSGTTIGFHVIAHSEYEAMQLAAERNPGFRAMWARRA